MSPNSPKNIKRFKTGLFSLKRSRHFISWREVRAFAGELRELLAELQNATIEPRLGVELVAKFYQLDRNIFDRCDDSSGYVGDLFRNDASELLIYYASRCDDKKWLVKLLLELSLENKSPPKSKDF